MKTIKQVLNAYANYEQQVAGGAYLNNDPQLNQAEALQEIQNILEGIDGKRKVLPSEPGNSPLKNTSEDYCIGYNQALDDCKKAQKKVLGV